MDHSLRKMAPGGDWNIRQQNAMVKSADSGAACLRWNPGTVAYV